MVEQKSLYRIAAPTEELSSLEKRALLLADRLKDTQNLKKSLAVKDNEKQIVGLLEKTGFKKSAHIHSGYPELYYGYCDIYFSRDASVAVMRIKLWVGPYPHHGFRVNCRDSKLYVIPTGKEMLDEIKEKMPWYAKIINAPVKFKPSESWYDEKFSTLLQKALSNTTDSLLYIARNAQRQ